MVGFRSKSEDVSVIVNLVEALRFLESETKAIFSFCGKVAAKIGSAISCLDSSTTGPRTRIVECDHGKTHTKHNVGLESDTEKRIYF